MREIKFRGWHVQNQRMFSAEEMEVDQLTMLTTGSFINVHGVHTHLSTIYDREKFIPMQYTGLRDKNGKEIYEGDVVRFAVDFPEQPFDDGIVRWADGGFWTSQTIDDLEELLSDELNDLEGEVIGNIYENPNLLQQ